jgi:hypothetical protein
MPAGHFPRVRVTGCPTVDLPVLLHNTAIGRNAVIRNAITDPGFDFRAERDAAAGLVDVLQGGMPGRRAEEFIHHGHCPLAGRTRPAR